MPIANGNMMDEECVCLQLLDENIKQDVFEEIIKRTVSAFDWVKGEDFVLYYDHKRFQDLYSKCSAQMQQQRPTPLQLLGSHCQLTKLPNSMPEMKVNHMSFTHGILCGYVNMDGEVLVDEAALRNRSQLDVEDTQGKKVSLVFLDCKREEIFKWFVANRHSKRKFDPDYEKHGTQQKGVGKDVVSPCSYPDEECEAMLPWAVGSPGCKRKYYKDFDKGRLIVFCNENLQTPTFHCYDVEIDDPIENSKLMKECGRDGVKQIEMIHKIRQEA